IRRSLTRNQDPAAIALVTAASRLMRMAYPAASGSSPHVWAISTNSGLPGGCGMPSTYAAAMYSDVSQNCVVGASVSTYNTRAPRDTRPAQRYGGRSGDTAADEGWERDRKSTRLNSSHVANSYAVLCLEKSDHRHERDL